MTTVALCCQRCDQKVYLQPAHHAETVSHGSSIGWVFETESGWRCPQCAAPADFGDYVLIEMKRYVGKNEKYLHKVVGRLRSSHAATVPIDKAGSGTKAQSLGGMHDVLNVIQCGVDETNVFKVRAADVSLARLARAED